MSNVATPACLARAVEKPAEPGKTANPDDFSTRAVRVGREARASPENGHQRDGCFRGGSHPCR
ncbi:protein of unknown function [Nitrospira japonica]|uniref:Uncharacterized protein n=1 Tax=Nitrospira japonica TaxID=1325564 RepID=A0A1W1I0K1_9BACT|nr:protein of unknown function [Nitrospira japonica]